MQLRGRGKREPGEGDEDNDGEPALPGHVLSALAAGETVQACFHCRPRSENDAHMLVITNLHVRAIRGPDAQSVFRLEDLVGVRERDTVVRLGFRPPGGRVALLTVITAPGRREWHTFATTLAAAWIRRTGLPYPAADLQNADEVPPIEAD